MSPESHAGPKLKGAAPLFAALGDPTRLALVARLSAGGPHSIAHLTAGSDVTRQAITKHLHVLAAAGVVRHMRRGREQIWRLEPERLEIARRFIDEISRQWDARVSRLRNLVERSAASAD
jgi:DNA-binding transcriptional ArsR family regulator